MVDVDGVARLLPPAPAATAPPDGLRPRQPAALRGLGPVPRAARAGRRSPSTCPAGGFPRAGRRGFDYSMHGLGALLRALAATGSGSSEHALVVHDWGALALIDAQRRPERVRAAGGHQRRAAAARLPLALDRALALARAGASASSPTATDHQGGDAAALAAGVGAAGPDAGRVHRRSVWARPAARDAGRPMLELYRSADPERARGGGRAASGGSAARRSSSGASTTPTCRRASAAPTPSACPNAELVELDRRRPLAVDRPARGRRSGRRLPRR